MNRDTAALAVIDVQERLIPAMAAFGPALVNMRRLIRGFQALDRPVLVTEQYPRGLGPTAPSIARLVPPPYHEKLAFGCFGCDSFVAALGAPARAGTPPAGPLAQDLVVCGIEAHVCVLQTVLGGLESGRRVWLAGDAVASRSLANRDLALARAAAAGAIVAATESILFELLQVAGTPEFRTVSKLVK